MKAAASRLSFVIDSLTLRTIIRFESQRCVSGAIHKCRLPSSVALGPDATQGPGPGQSAGGRHSLSVWSQTYDRWRSKKTQGGCGDGRMCWVKERQWRRLAVKPTWFSSKRLGQSHFSTRIYRNYSKTFENLQKLRSAQFSNLPATIHFFPFLLGTQPSQVPHSWSMHSSFFSITHVLISLVCWSCSQQGKVKRSMSWGSILLYSVHMQGLILRGGCPS